MSRGSRYDIGPVDDIVARMFDHGIGLREPFKQLGLKAVSFADLDLALDSLAVDDRENGPVFPDRNRLLVGIFNVSSVSQITTRTSTRKPSPRYSAAWTGSSKSTITLTLCSSTPNAESLVNPDGSTSLTRPSRVIPPPHCSMRTL